MYWAGISVNKMATGARRREQGNHEFGVEGGNQIVYVSVRNQ